MGEDTERSQTCQRFSPGRLQIEGETSAAQMLDKLVGPRPMSLFNAAIVGGKQKQDQSGASSQPGVGQRPGWQVRKTGGRVRDLRAVAFDSQDETAKVPDAFRDWGNREQSPDWSQS